MKKGLPTLHKYTKYSAGRQPDEIRGTKYKEAANLNLRSEIQNSQKIYFQNSKIILILC